MVILYILGLMGWVAIIFIIFGICSRDYTKDEKVKSGNMKKIARRVKNKIIGRKMIKKIW